jgi:hypothetical protein
LAIIVIGHQDIHIIMAAKFLHPAHISPGGIEGGGDGTMADTVG